MTKSIYLKGVETTTDMMLMEVQSRMVYQHSGAVTTNSSLTTKTNTPWKTALVEQKCIWAELSQSHL